MSNAAIQLGTRAEIRPASALEVDALLELARERAPDGTIFDNVSPFFWQVRASSNRLDYYDTRMRAGEGRTLDNFARALAEGTSYQDSHKWYQNGWGRSLTGRVIETDEVDPEIDEKIIEVWGELYTLPGLQLGEQSTDSLIAAIRSGIWRDVSVGFSATDIECSICGKQSFQWWKEDGCQHIPGYTYTFQDQTARAFAWINDGELNELSQVYKGASPAAAVIKAEQMNQDGRLSDGERAFIERRHNVRIAEPQRSWALRSISGKEPTMTDKKELTDTTRSAIVEAMARASEAGYITFDPEKDALGDAVHRLVGSVSDMSEALEEARAESTRATGALTEARAKIAELEPQAADGKRYRDDLIADTLVAGARALGKEFREEMYRGLLEKASLDQIRVMKDDFTSQGDELFARRLTTDEPETPTTSAVKDTERYKG